MLTQHENSNWIINLTIFCYSNIIILESCELNNLRNDSYFKQPQSWPCEWNNGVIPFAFDFFALSPKRLVSLVKKAHRYLEEHSCLVFKEMNPVEAAREFKFTYIFYTYSEVLESCCMRFFTKKVGRRLVLITPVCFLQLEVAHAILHALGLEHDSTEPFSDTGARGVMFPYKCKDINAKLAALEGIQS